MIASSWGYLPGFSHRLCGRRALSEAARLHARSDELDGLAALVTRFIPASAFAHAAGQHERVFTPWVTFITFLGQVLSRGSACREAVRWVQAWRWCGRSVKVLDGCGLSMPDTDENRAHWPYAGGQKPGCGFPMAQLVGLFCLATGRLVHFALGTWKAYELPLVRQLIGWIERGEIVLTDRRFCGWGFIALLQRKGVDVVVRIVRFRVAVPGFRTKEVVLVTTLLDSKAYPDETGSDDSKTKFSDV